MSPLFGGSTVVPSVALQVGYFILSDQPYLCGETTHVSTLAG